MLPGNKNYTTISWQTACWVTFCTLPYFSLTVLEFPTWNCLNCQIFQRKWQPLRCKKLNFVTKNKTNKLVHCKGKRQLLPFVREKSVHISLWQSCLGTTHLLTTTTWNPSLRRNSHKSARPNTRNISFPQKSHTRERNGQVEQFSYQMCDWYGKLYILSCQSTYQSWTL